MAPKKRVNIVYDLMSKELGFGRRHVHRMSTNILRKLVCSPDSYYKECATFVSNQGDILYQAGLIYIRNKMQSKVECYTMAGCGGKPKKIYSLPLKPIWENQEIWDCPVAEMPIRNKGHLASLLVLTTNGFLKRFDLKTGNILEEIYLGTKFVDFFPDEETGRLCIKSQRVNQNTRVFHDGNMVPPDRDILLTMAIFSMQPVEFIGAFQISKSVFGDKVVDAACQQGILLVMHSSRVIQLFSLYDILQKSMLACYKLGEDVYINDTKYVVGQKPYGVPINIVINERPPVLLEVVSVNFQLQIGANPWHYVRHLGAGSYEVCDLDSKSLIENGVIQFHTDYYEPDQVMFHPDDSNRIIHLSNSKLRIHHIGKSSYDGCSPALTDWFTFEADPDFAVSSVGHPDARSSYGRKLKSVRSNVGMFPTPDVDITFDYDDDMDLFGILLARDRVDNNESRLFYSGRFNDDSMILDNVKLYDNATGEQVKEISLGNTFPCHTGLASVHLHLDGPYLVVKAKFNNRTSVFFYKLERDCNMEEESVLKPRMPGSPKRKMSVDSLSTDPASPVRRSARATRYLNYREF